MASKASPAASTSRLRRVAKELQDIRNDKDNSQVMAAPINEQDLTHLKGTFPAPPDTPYAGGTYTVDIVIPDNYPFKSPIMKFDTKIWHPNISSQTVSRSAHRKIPHFNIFYMAAGGALKLTRGLLRPQGAICLDTLGSGWSPVGTIKMALLSLRMLLESPNPRDPQDAEVAKMMMDDPDYFAVVAHDWAVKYAGAPRTQPPPDQYARTAVKAEKKPDDPTRYHGYNKDLIDRFVNMGFELDKVVEAFMYVGIDRNGGEDYELEEAYMGDITARLLGEQ